MCFRLMTNILAIFIGKLPNVFDEKSFLSKSLSWDPTRVLPAQVSNFLYENKKKKR